MKNAQVADVSVWSRLPGTLSWKEKIAYLGVQFQKSDLKAPKCLVDHLLGHGKYVRTIRIPAHTLFLGREHIRGHEVSLLVGSVILITPEGKKVMEAPITVHTVPGYHMVVYTLTDIEAQSVHANPGDALDAEALESAYFEPADKLYQLGLQVDERLRALT
jgi:hypothetical protein